MKISLNTARRPPLPWSADARFAADFAAGAFSRDGVFVPPDTAFSLTRNSIKWAQDAQSQWHQFPANQPAMTDRGLSVEPEGTNLIPNSGNSGAVASATDGLDGLPSGWDRAKFDGTAVRGRVLETDTLLGLPALTIRLWGDASVGDAEIRWFVWSALASNMDVVQGDQLLVSFFVQHIAGSMNGITPRMRITERDAAGDYLVKQTESFVPGTKAGRIAHAFTVSHPDALHTAAGFEFAFSGVFDVTLKIAAVQIERNAGPNPGSPIITYGAPASRAPDAVTLHLPNAPATLVVTGAEGETSAIAGQSGDTVLNAAGLPGDTIRSVIGYPD